MKQLRIQLLALALALPALVACNESANGGPTAATEPAKTDTASESANLWRRTRETATGWWNGSRRFAEQTLEDARGLLGDDGDDFASVFAASMPKLEEALELEKRQQTLPEQAWFGADQRSNQIEINALLDQAVEILSGSPASRYRARIQERQEAIVEARTELAKARQQRISAPESSTLKKTRSDYDERIARLEREIAEHQSTIVELRHRFAAELRASGLDLTDEQVEFLLATVVGDQMVDLGIVFDNVREITRQLEQLVEHSGEDLQSARRYYGIYVVLLESLQRMHTHIRTAIAEDYLPRIDTIAKRAEMLSGQTRELLRRDPAKQAVLNANLEAQTLTIEATRVYRQYLQEQARQVKHAARQLDKDIAAAWNTYETVRVSGELVGLVKSSRRLLEELMNREVPTLRPFENLEMQREFQRLTSQLRTTAGN